MCFRVDLVATDKWSSTSNCPRSNLHWLSIHWHACLLWGCCLFHHPPKMMPQTIFLDASKAFDRIRRPQIANESNNLSEDDNLCRVSLLVSKWDRGLMIRPYKTDRKPFCAPHRLTHLRLMRAVLLPRLLPLCTASLHLNLSHSSSSTNSLQFLEF